MAFAPGRIGKPVRGAIHAPRRDRVPCLVEILSTGPAQALKIRNDSSNDNSLIQVKTRPCRGGKIPAVKGCPEPWPERARDDADGITETQEGKRPIR